MEIIGFSKYGKPTQLKKTTVAYPHGFDTSNNIVIKVHASAINPVDKALLSGDLKMVRPVAAFPHVICYDVAGVVEESDDNGKFSVGQHVFARLFGNENDGKKTPWYRGAMAEYCVADTNNVVLKPENLTFEEAASIPLVGMTALQALKSSGLKEGGSIFISGGAGGVGTIAIQLAKYVFKAGLVVTTATGGEKEKLCKSLLKLFLKRKKKRKEFKAANSVGANWDYLFLSPSQEDLSTLANHLASGEIKPVLDNVWDFHSQDLEEGWKGAFNRSFSGRAKGKCVVKITP